MVLRTGYIVYFWNIPKCDDGDNLKLTVKTTKTVITNAMSSWTIRRAYQWVLGKWFFPLQTQEGFSIWQVTFEAALYCLRKCLQKPKSGNLIVVNYFVNVEAKVYLATSHCGQVGLFFLNSCVCIGWLCSGGKNVAFTVGG